MLSFLGIQVSLSSGVLFLSAATAIQITSLFISSSPGIIGYLYLVIGTTVIAFMIVLLAVPETKVRGVLQTLRKRRGLGKHKCVLLLLTYPFSYL